MIRGRYVWLFVLASLLPFIRRPWLFDDPSVVITSRATAAHPLDPYTYKLDLGYPDQLNWAPGAWPSYTHPPFSAWCLGALLRVTGDHEWPLHAFFFLMALLIVWLVCPIAAFFTKEKGTALIWFAFSPVFFLTTLTLYPHFFYFLFYCVTLICAWHVQKKASLAWATGMGVALTLAALSLHQWPILVLLLVLYFGVHMKEAPIARPSAFLGVAVFAVLYGSWCVWETHLYGMPHFLATMHVRASGTAYAWRASFLPLVFLSGGIPVVAIAWHVLAKRSQVILGILVGVMLCMGVYLAGPRGGFLRHQAFLLALFFGTGLAFLSALPYMVKEGTSSDRFLVGWFLVEFIFIQKFLTYPSGHHFLEVGLPAVLLAVRMVELFPLNVGVLRIGTLLLWILTMALAQADQSLAAIGPQLAEDLSGLPGHHYYWGNSFSGYSYYLKKAGWQPYDSRVHLNAKDVLLVPKNFNASGPLRFPSRQKLSILGERRYRARSVLRTFSIDDSAGWYSASWGALPYSYTSNPTAEVFTFYRGVDAPPSRSR